MKIYMKAYLSHNLGDDLFVKLLVDRYKEHKFYAISNGFKYNKYNNLKVYSNKLICKIINKLKLEKYLANMCDITVTIGGSIYMERNKKDQKRKFQIGNNKHYILGCNFGPYKTQEYLNNVKKTFENAEDVCFREKYSYELFKDLKNVRYAPDILFSLDTGNISNTNSINNTSRKRAIISVISCDYKIGKEYQENYENKMIEIIKFLIEKEYEICLMSFCKREKDEEAIERLLQKCDEKTRKKIEKYYYTGNTDEALKVMADSSLIVGSRFHANILGMVLGKPVIPVIYSDKMVHVLEDMGTSTLKTIDIRTIKDFDVNSITEEDLNRVINVDRERKESIKHFEKLGQ